MNTRLFFTVCQQMLLFQLILLIGTHNVVFGLIGYDCGAPNVNITKISLLDVHDCDASDIEVNVTTVNVQLLQITEFQPLPVKQCQVEITRHIKHCSYWGYNYDVVGGVKTYSETVTRARCDDYHRYLKYSVSSSHTFDLSPNSTTSTGEITVVGWNSADGTCQGKWAEYDGISYNSVFVKVYYKVSLYDYVAVANMQKNVVILKDGTRCPLENEECIDSKGMTTFWTKEKPSDCELTMYGSLHSGKAEKVQSLTQDHYIETVYTVNDDRYVYAFKEIGTTNMCGYTVRKLDHSKFVLIELPPGSTVSKNQKLMTEDLDLIAYMNTKIVYVERHFRKQLEGMYRNLIESQCEIEKQVLKNALALIRTDPMEFAYQIMHGKEGYMAIKNGEVATILECAPVQVDYRKVEGCYDELPVTWNDQPFFLAAKSRVILTKGREISCDPTVAPMFKINNEWYKTIGRGNPPERTFPPKCVKPTTKASWYYQFAGNLLNGGLYVLEDIKRLGTYIMSIAETLPWINNLVRVAYGMPMSDQQKVNLNSLLNMENLKNVIHESWIKFLSGITFFGNATSTLLGLYCFYAIIQTVVNTIINGAAIHSVHGWSFHLLGAICNSLTSCLLVRKPHKDKKREKNKTRNTKKQTFKNPEETEETESFSDLNFNDDTNLSQKKTSIFVIHDEVGNGHAKSKSKLESTCPLYEDLENPSFFDAEPIEKQNTLPISKRNGIQKTNESESNKPSTSVYPNLVDEMNARAKITRNQ